MTETLAHFANLKLAGDRLVRDAIISMTAAPARSAPARGGSRSVRARGSGGRLRRPRRRGGQNVGAMTDAELEAELVQRRASRTHERNRYARAMRSEKLTALEDELMRLRGEIAKIDPGIPRRAAGIGSTSQNNAHVTWDTLPGQSEGEAPRVAASAAPAWGSGPPPLPPMKNSSGGADAEDDALVVDPEQQRRDKAERQRRREEKRKQREAAKKPLTLAEIIRSAGPDPVKRLRPATPKVAPEPVAFAALTGRESLTKAAPIGITDKPTGDANSSDAGELEDSSSAAAKGDLSPGLQTESHRSELDATRIGSEVSFPPAPKTEFRAHGESTDPVPATGLHHDTALTSPNAKTTSGTNIEPRGIPSDAPSPGPPPPTVSEATAVSEAPTSLSPVTDTFSASTKMSSAATALRASAPGLVQSAPTPATTVAPSFASGRAETGAASSILKAGLSADAFAPASGAPKPNAIAAAAAAAYVLHRPASVSAAPAAHASPTTPTASAASVAPAVSIAPAASATLDAPASQATPAPPITSAASTTSDIPAPPTAHLASITPSISDILSISAISPPLSPIFEPSQDLSTSAGMIPLPATASAVQAGAAAKASTSVTPSDVMASLSKLVAALPGASSEQPAKSGVTASFLSPQRPLAANKAPTKLTLAEKRMLRRSGREAAAQAEAKGSSEHSNMASSHKID
jgi:Mitochondrial fission regulator